MFVDDYGFADEVWIFRKPSFPEVVTDNGDGMRTRRSIVVLREETSGPRSHAEHFEKVSADQFAAHAFVLIGVTDVHLRAAARDDAGEDVAAIAQVLVHRVRERALDAWSFFRIVRGEHDELIGIVDRQALQQHLVGDREDRGVRADAECEREHDDGGEAWVLGEQPNGVANVLDNLCHQRCHHSYLSATSGSTFVARRAGM